MHQGYSPHHWPGATIWCFTSDSEVTWQECQPIGVLRPACRNGAWIRDGGEGVGEVAARGRTFGGVGFKV